MHLFTLLSGLRRSDVVTASWANLDRQKRALRIPSPKGGEDRAFELPLSQAMLDCLDQALEAGRTFFPEEARTWIFPSSGGHVVETKEPKRKLTHTGHALRHSYRTLAAAAGIDRLRVKILINHAIDGDVTDSYTNVPALFASLLEAQERISSFISKSVENKQ